MYTLAATLKGPRGGPERARDDLPSPILNPPRFSPNPNEFGYSENHRWM